MSDDAAAPPQQPTAADPRNDSVTAADFLQHQARLEREARETMPYEPDSCTYPQPLRQAVYACLTCRAANHSTDIGVCYLCLIQCHSTHDLVELFSKRNFACDCGTCRMGTGRACAVRARHSGQPQAASKPPAPRMRSGSVAGGFEARKFSTAALPRASDIECLGNSYNHNFAGRFCSCNVLYNPLQETQTMHQCFLGDVCGEDWYHQECVLGYAPGTFRKPLLPGSGENWLDGLPPPESDAATECALPGPAADPVDPVMPHFPELASFAEFVCWRCVAKHRPAFDELVAHLDVVVATRPRFAGVCSAEQWASLDREARGPKNEPLVKRQKTGAALQVQAAPYSVFLAEDSHTRLSVLRDLLPPSSPLRLLLVQFDFLAKDDPIYQPVEDEAVSTQASESSLYDLGSTALLELPIPQALEGLQAYDAMKEKLRGFFKDFVDQKKVVTEEEVRDFFDKMKEK